MADNAPSTDEGQFSIGTPSQYVGGHIAIGVITFLETAVPIILYYAWQMPRLDMMTKNDWYSYAW